MKTLLRPWSRAAVVALALLGTPSAVLAGVTVAPVTSWGDFSAMSGSFGLAAPIATCAPAPPSPTAAGLVLERAYFGPHPLGPQATALILRVSYPPVRINGTNSYQLYFGRVTESISGTPVS